jgi:hypothetical protein
LNPSPKKGLPVSTQIQRKMELLNKYKNGNYTVSIFDDGTKEREFEETPNPVWPESMDVKVTDYCDAGCKFCHEMSTTSGKEGNLNVGLNLFRDLPAGTEIAIGGGNPLSWGGLDRFVSTMSDRGVICNMTVNSVHVKRYDSRIGWFTDGQKGFNKGKIHGLGLSYFKPLFKDCLEITKVVPHVVFHLIMGIHTLEDLDLIASRVSNPKVLLLGYKQYGRGENFYSKAVSDNIQQWYYRLHEFFRKDGLTISFDNLGIKQMNLKRFFNKEEWEKFYMGDDGKFTCYVDLVKKQYATSSTSKERFDILPEDTTQSIFKRIRNEQ